MDNPNRYSLLFEPVNIGPVTARNRFYQVPHCNGMGHIRPQAEAAMRGMKAEGGWAVVSNQETEIHPSSDLSPYAEGRIWDKRDIPALRLLTDAVHEHGSLAAIELAHNGHHAQNHFTRRPPVAVADMVIEGGYPKQARAMTRKDIRLFRRWHRDAALRARDAGFDIIYVYAGHGMALPQQFMLPHLNTRTDEYGGSLENRVRLTKELLEETREAVGDTCAVAFRFAVDEMLGTDGMQATEEGRAIVEMLSELPDLWDVNVSGWPNDSVTSRFQSDDGYQNDYIRFVKTITSKPVVAVGRLTSADKMLSMVKQGIVDFIGAARPSIADPFLPLKIQEDRIDDIRECIGCNICASADGLGVPIRCTQNPTMGEEWRRGWHPESIEPAQSDTDALVIGAGPAGLECALSLANRGYQVTLAEASDEAGGRALLESGLSGLSAWKRVVDYRTYRLGQLPNVNLYLQSRLAVDDVVELGIPNVFVATGANWRADGIGQSTRRTTPTLSPDARVMTPDDILNGRLPDSGPVLIYDDEHGYLGGVLADHLLDAGLPVIFVTSASVVSPFTELTLEQDAIQTRLIERCEQVICGFYLVAQNKEQATIACVYTGRQQQVSATSLISVTERQTDNTLYNQLVDSKKFNTVELIGDALAPGLIADAVWSGHYAARNFERPAADVSAEWYRREMITIAPQNPS